MADHYHAMGRLLAKKFWPLRIKSIEQLYAYFEATSEENVAPEKIDRVTTFSRKNWLIGNLEYLCELADNSGLALLWGDQSCKYDWSLQEGEDGNAPYWVWNALIVPPADMEKLIVEITALLAWSQANIKQLAADEVMGYEGLPALTEAIDNAPITNNPTGNDDGNSVDCLYSFLASMRQLMRNALASQRPLLYVVQTPHPAPHARQRKRDLEEFHSQPRFFYGDGVPIMVGDAVLFDYGLYPGRVRKLMVSTGADGKPFAAGVKVDEVTPGKMRAVGLNKVKDGIFPELRRVERSSRNFLEAGLACLRLQADEGNTSAQFALGNLYVTGYGLAKDTEQGAVWLRKAADAGSAQAQYHLGNLYARGDGVPEHEGEALAWHYKAAQQGHAEGAQAAAHALRSTGREDALQLAFSLHMMAAQRGLVAAEFSVGFCYDNGIGVERDHGKAVEWFLKGAQKGYGPSLCNLADKYEHGLGVPQNYTKALNLYLQAAQNRVVEAMYSLGGMNLHGKGTPANRQAAVHWWREAAALGYEDAKLRLKELESS